MLIYKIIFLTLLLLFILNISKKFGILRDEVFSSHHKKITNIDNSPVLIGGVFLFSCILFFFSNNFVILKIFGFIILVLGLFSDKNIVHEPKLRIIFQILILIVFVIFNKLQIDNIRIEFFDTMLQNKYFNISFTVFCFAILLNGTNFIDGLNGLAIGYYILVLSAIFYLSSINSDVQLRDLVEYEILIYCMIIFFIFNFFGKCFLGDSGAYFISFLAGFFLIKFFNFNLYLSPYFIALLLWYPAFETLFSLLRRFTSKFSVSDADNLHLHHLVLFSLKKKISSNYVNSIASVIIIIYNFLIIFVSLDFINNSKIMIFLIIFNITNYLLIYKYLSKLKLKN